MNSRRGRASDAEGGARGAGDAKGTEQMAPFSEGISFCGELSEEGAICSVPLASDMRSEITLPASRVMMRSAWAASVASCVAISTVMPPSTRRQMVLMNRARLSGSSMLDASSSSSTRGRMASAPASARRCFCPPESECVCRSSKPARSAAASASATRSRISSGASPRFSGPKATSFCTTGATS